MSRHQQACYRYNLHATQTHRYQPLQKCQRRDVVYHVRTAPQIDNRKLFKEPYYERISLVLFAWLSTKCRTFVLLNYALIKCFDTHNFIQSRKRHSIQYGSGSCFALSCLLDRNGAPFTVVAVASDSFDFSTKPKLSAVSSIEHRMRCRTVDKTRLQPTFQSHISCKHWLVLAQCNAFNKYNLCSEYLKTQSDRVWLAWSRPNANNNCMHASNYRICSYNQYYNDLLMQTVGRNGFGLLHRLDAYTRTIVEFHRCCTHTHKYIRDVYRPMKRSLHCTYPRSLHTENKHIRKWTISLTYIIRWITAARVCQCAHHHHYHRLFVRKMKQTFRALILCIASNTFFFIIMPQNSRNSTEKPTITNLLSAQGADDCMFHNGFLLLLFFWCLARVFHFVLVWKIQQTTNNINWHWQLVCMEFVVLCEWACDARVSHQARISHSPALYIQSRRW